MFKKLTLILILVGTFTLLGNNLFARRFGGSFGGRSFGRSYGRSYSRRSYGGYRRGYRRYGYGGYRRYGYSRGIYCAGGGITILIIVGILIAAIVIVTIAKRKGSGSTPGMGTIIKFQTALYTDNQGSIQKEIIDIGKRANTNSPEGQARLLNDIMVYLGRKIQDISHYHYQSSEKMDVGILEQKFDSFSASERTKYDVESFSNRDGVKRTEKFTPDEDSLEISQFVVLTAIIATERADLQKIQITDQHQLKDLLNKLAGISGRSLYAVEFIVTPSEPTDALSRETMELEFPELKIL